ncbi:MAG: protein kinase, partial [Acidobacteriaceae bacterium]|nr:protein kinase [Acidobacteriaceae bacterium]
TYFLIIIAAIVAVMIRNYGRVTEPDLMRRVKWVAYASAGAILPISTYMIASFLASVSGNSWLMRTPFWYNFNRFENFALILLPVTFGYCVVKHRVMGIDVVLRRGLQYLLAKNSLRFLLLLPWMSLASTLVLHPEMRLKDMFVSASLPFYAGASLAAGASIRYRRQVMQFVDRRFFRDTYDREQILLELIDDMNCASTVDELAQLVKAKLDAALHPISLMLTYNEAHSPKDRLTVALDSCRTAFEVRSSGSRLSQHDRQWLSELGVDLVVPILAGDDRLVGAMLLGEKKSEEPYTKSDRAMLQTVAAQFSAVAENVWLRQRVAEERSVRHEVLARLTAVPSLVKECPACGACFDNDSSRCSRDGAELTLTLPVERIVDSRYRLDRRIGRGSMGTVYEAWDLRLSRRVAVKVLTGRLFGQRPAQRRFEREARLLARLNHDNIVAVHDYGLIDGGGAYLVMEYLDGANLRQELARCGSIPAALAADWIDQLLAGVAAAHAHQVVHRDLKPENVFVSRGQDTLVTVKVLDFGVATLWQGTELNTLTSAGSIVGTLGYMAPEQMLGQPVDARTDIFAIGVIVLEGLNGRHPFAQGPSNEILAAIRRYEPSAPTPELTAILRRCVASEPDRRYGSVDELRNDLSPALRVYCTLMAADSAAPTSTLAVARSQSL